MAEKLSNQLARVKIYFRLSVDRSLETIGLKNWVEL